MNPITKVVETSLQVTEILKTTTSHSNEAIILASLAKATEELGEVSQAILRTLQFNNASRSAESNNWEASQECIDGIICLIDLFAHLVNYGHAQDTQLNANMIGDLIETSLNAKLPKWRSKYGLDEI